MRAYEVMEPVYELMLPVPDRLEIAAGTQFTCFTSTKAQILTQRSCSASCVGSGSSPGLVYEA